MTEHQRHPTAIIASGAELADDVEVGPYAVIEDQVSIGAGSSIGPHAVIHSHARMGARNRVHAHAVTADTPQDDAYAGEETWVEIGDDNIFRECVTVHRSTDVDLPTRVGSRCFLMAYCHVAHGCQVRDGVIMTTYAGLAGHVEAPQFISSAESDPGSYWGASPAFARTFFPTPWPRAFRRFTTVSTPWGSSAPA